MVDGDNLDVFPAEGNSQDIAAYTVSYLQSSTEGKCIPMRPNPLMPTLQDEEVESPTGKSLIEGAIFWV